MGFDSPQNIKVHSAHRDHGAPSYYGPNIQVQIPRMSMNSMQHNGHGNPAYGQKSTFLPDPHVRQEPAQSQPALYQSMSSSAVADEYLSSVAHATPLKSHLVPIDHQHLLLSLAEDYFAAAHGEGSMAAMLQRDKHADHYYKLIATGLGCLEAVLKVDLSQTYLKKTSKNCQNWRLQPRLEAATRLRYASILYQETENYIEIEEALSQGVCLFSSILNCLANSTEDSVM